MAPGSRAFRADLVVLRGLRNKENFKKLNFVVKAAEPCWNIKISNVTYSERPIREAENSSSKVACLDTSRLSTKEHSVLKHTFYGSKQHALSTELWDNIELLSLT